MKTEKNNIDQSLLIAAYYLDIGDNDHAIREFLLILDSEIDSENKKLVLIGLQTAYVQKENWAKVIEYCKEELELELDNETVHLRLANAYTENNQFEKAEIEYKKSLSINPTCAESRYQLGNLYKYQGKLSDALIEYKTAISIDPENPLFYSSAVDIFLAFGDLLKARSMLNQSIILGLKSEEAIELLKDINNEINRKERKNSL